MNLKLCNKCKERKERSCFTKDRNKKDGLSTLCRDCRNKYQKELRASRPDVVEGIKLRNERIYATPKGRAKSLYRAMLKRSVRYDENVDFDVEFIEEKIRNGFCEVTGEEFTLDSNEPNSPSIDRVVPDVGYIKDNVRVVTKRFNFLKREMSDLELYEICKKVVDNAEILCL